MVELGRPHGPATDWTAQDGFIDRCLNDGGCGDAGQRGLSCHAHLHPTVDFRVAQLRMSRHDERTGVVLDLEEAADQVGLVPVDPGRGLFESDLDVEALGDHVAVGVPPVRALVSLASPISAFVISDRARYTWHMASTSRLRMDVWPVSIRHISASDHSSVSAARRTVIGDRLRRSRR
jgi:hypothetical protein